ncbi:hypothetical protein HYV82_02960 [Candidatus Woesearchaeota archaeon]|nr:hypothetical protein [Candidatus Woesearchaeota archaeon]
MQASETVRRIMDEKLGTPKSMFGSLKGKMRPFTREERIDMWKLSTV